MTSSNFVGCSPRRMSHRRESRCGEPSPPAGGSYFNTGSSSGHLSVGDARRVPPKTEGQPQQQETEDQRIGPDQPHEREQPDDWNGHKQDAEEDRERAVEPKQPLALDRPT